MTRGREMTRAIRAGLVTGLVGAATLLVPVAAAASSTPAAQIKAVYRTVLSAEYFGPASRVCSHLTAAAQKTFAKDFGASSCTRAVQEGQHTLQHKVPGNDNSGYTPGQWRTEVSSVIAALKVTVHGSHASAIGGDSGIPGRTTLVLVGGQWEFSGLPPSVDS
jgi:hypothetical protein